MFTSFVTFRVWKDNAGASCSSRNVCGGKGTTLTNFSAISRMKWVKEHRNALKFFELNFEKAFYHSLCSKKKKNMQWEIGTQQTMILPVETWILTPTIKTWNQHKKKTFFTVKNEKTRRIVEQGKNGRKSNWEREKRV